MRPELLAIDPLWITNNQQNIGQDLMVSLHSNFLQEQSDGGLFYWPNHSWETWLSTQGEEEEV